MRRDLSSAQTVLMKIIFPAVWISGLGLVTIMLFTHPSPSDSGVPPPPEMKWYFLLIWGVGSAFIYWGCARLKRVGMDRSFLYISNYVREAKVPLRQVAAVTENRWISIHPVTIEFRSATEFGNRVVFIPKARWFEFWSSHPVVAEIREAVERATGLGSTGSP